jgi:hypothetical protein
MTIAYEYGVKRPSTEYGEVHTALLYTPTRIGNAIQGFNSYFSKSKIHVREPDFDSEDIGVITLKFQIEDDLSANIKTGFKRLSLENQDDIYDDKFRFPHIVWIAKPGRNKELLRKRNWYTDITNVYGGKYINDSIVEKESEAPPYTSEYLDFLQNLVQILKINALRYQEI